jgi:alkylhydroperoxidase family enzyme
MPPEPAALREIHTMAFPVHSAETAPEGSRTSLEALRSAFGFLPNIAGVLAASPILIGGLVSLFGQVHGGSFSEPQIQTVLLTNAVTNRATWAVAFHSFLAIQAGLDCVDVDTIRAGRSPSDAGLAALSTLARTLIDKRGHLDDHEASAFLVAGFDKRHLLEVIAIVAASTITNYGANIGDPPLEPQFQPYAWRAPLN